MTIKLAEPNKKLDRTKGLGGSDLGAIAGVNPFKTAIEVYLEKVGLVPQQEETERMKWGKILEEPIAREYAERENVKLKTIDTVFDDKKQMFYGSPDRIIQGQDKGLEVKTAGLQMARNFGEEGTDDIPEPYRVQIAWYQGLLHFSQWDLAVLIGGQELKIFRIQRDLELEGMLRYMAEKFWKDHVLRKEPPKPDASEASAKALAKLFPQNKGEFRQATNEEILLADTLEEVRKELGIWETKQLELKNKLKFAIGDKDGIEGPFGRISWKKTKGRKVVNFKAIMDEWTVPRELVEKHTRITDGVRRFMVSIKTRS